MWWTAGAPIWWCTKSNSAVPYILLWESVKAAHFHCIWSLWNCDNDNCERDPCFQVHLNLQVWFKSFDACLFEEHLTVPTVLKKFGIFNESTILTDSQSIAEQNRCQLFDSPETDPAPNISNHPGIERLSKQCQVDVSYPETRLAYSRRTRSIQPSISLLRNEVQTHPKGTMLSSLMVSDLTPHPYSIQWPFLTSRHSLLSCAPTSRHASERFILLHLKDIFFLPECFESVPASTHRESSFRHETFRCRHGSSRLA